MPLLLLMCCKECHRISDQTVKCVKRKVVGWCLRMIIRIDFSSFVCVNIRRASIIGVLVVFSSFDFTDVYYSTGVKYFTVKNHLWMAILNTSSECTCILIFKGKYEWKFIWNFKSSRQTWIVFYSCDSEGYSIVCSVRIVAPTVLYMLLCMQGFYFRKCIPQWFLFHVSPNS